MESSPPAGPPFVAGSFNVRYDNPADGADAWPHRCERVRALIDFHRFDVLGVQEALAHQVEFLASGRLGFVGVGREDGAAAGEFAPILFDRARFAATNGGTFWLSPTPEKPSPGWDAACTRVCTWARLEDRAAGGRPFFVFNTHLDHRGPVAQAEGAALVATRVREIAAGEPCLLLGDFNVGPGSVPLRRITEGGVGLRDARLVSETPPYGPPGTFRGFRYGAEPAEAPIDHAFVSGRLRVLRFGHLPDAWGGRCPSDHLPVLLECRVVP